MFHTPMRTSWLILPALLLSAIVASIATGQSNVSIAEVVTQKRQAFHLSGAEAATLREQFQCLASHAEGGADWKRHRESYLRQAVAAGKIELFDALLHDDPSKPARDHNGKTALMYAAEAGLLEVTAKLLPLREKTRWTFRYSSDYRAGLEYLNACDDVTDATFGYTALMYAASAGKADVAAYLLNAGADPDRQCGFAQFKAAQLAQMGGNGDIVALIDQKMADRPWYQQMWDSVDFKSSAFWWGLGVLGATMVGLWRIVRVFRRHWAETIPPGQGA